LPVRYDRSVQPGLDSSRGLSIWPGPACLEVGRDAPVQGVLVALLRPEEGLLQPLYEAGRTLGRPPASRDAIDAEASPPETMRALLDDLRADRDGAAAYLRA